MDYILENENIDYKSLLESAFEHLSVPAVLLNDAGLCIRGNRAFWEFVGPPAATLATNVFICDYIVPNDRDSIIESLADLKSEGRDDVQTRFISRTGHVSSVTITIMRLPQSDLILASVNDVRDSVEAQREFQRRTEDLENLFYLISHNLKSPLVSIQGFINLLLDNRKEGNDEELDHYLQRISKNAERMNAMVQDILAFSKVSKKDYSFEHISLADVLNSIYTEHYFRLKEKQIKLSIPSDLPSLIADKEGLTTIFENLLDNSIKYIGEAGEPEIEIGWESKGRFLVFWVRDNGIGLAEQYHDKVFNLFDRGDSNKKKSIEGTGVGLAIVKKIVELHGGMVRLASGPGKGTTVYFTLPLITGAAEEQEDG